MQTPKRRAGGRALLRVVEILAWAAFFLFAATFLLLRFWVLPQVEQHQGEVIAALTRATGLPVKIGALQADWYGLHPRLTVSDLRVHDSEGREALVLPSVELGVAWSTLLARELRLYSLAIEGPRLKVRRDAQGAIHVAGIRLGPAPGASQGDGQLTDLILAQREIVIRNAEIEWLDEKRGAPPLALRSLQLRLRNFGEVHRIGLSARPPRALGSGVELRASLVGPSVTQPGAWNGRVYAELGATDLAGWRAWFDYPVEVSSGQGALRVWATFGAGKIVDATADLALAGVVTRLGTGLPPLRLASVAGRVQGRQTQHGYEFGVRRLAMVPEVGPAMRNTTFRASWEAARDAQPARGAVSAETVELLPLARLAEFLPFPPDLRKLLAELAPRGRLLDANFEWSGELPDAARFRSQARFEGLSMSAWRAIPGFANLSGRLEATETWGSLSLASQNAEIDLPRVFPEPRIRLASLSGEVGWERGGGGVTVRLARLGFANEDLAGTASGSYTYTGEGPGSIDLTALLNRASGANLPRYLPLATIMGEKTRGWLAGAIRGGQTNDARLRLRGALRDFPFRDPAQGEFQVAAPVRGATLAFAQDWPVVEDIDGELLFERDRMTISARSARILGTSVSGARAEIAKLRAPATLVVTGNAQGPSAEFLRYVRSSPLRRTVGAAADGADASGWGQLRLRLELPLSELDKSKVEGEFRFAGNTLQLGARLPPIERAAATVAFTESSIQVRDASGRFLGGPLRVIGGTQRGVVVLGASGTFTVAGLDPLLDERWRRALAGSARYTATVRMSREGGAQVAFESSLNGVAVNLPPPLAKPALEPRLLRVSLVQDEGGARDRVSLGYGPQVRAEFLRRKEGDAMVLDRSAVAFNPPAGGRLRLPARADSMLVYGTLDRLELDRWTALLESAGGSADALSATSFELDIGALDAFGRRMQDIAVKARVGAGGWRASLNSAEIAGDVAYETAGGAKLVARMARFSVPPESPGEQAARATGELPSLDLVADDFGWRGKRFGRVEILARRDGAQWLLERVAMVNPEGSLVGKGEWRTAPATSTSVSFDIESGDVGRFLERVGYPGVVSRGKLKAHASLAWNGEPAAIDYPSLSGEVQLHAEDGQFLEVDPGIGKLVSLMSLQMLPRRITLDFRDVFSKGFQWDRIDATAQVAQGVMQTNDFRMRGSAAEVQMKGKADLVRETQDLRVQVVPSLGAGAATLICLANPAICLTTIIADRLLKNPLGQIFAFEYAISGSWSDPKVEKVAIAPTGEPPKPPTGD
jgi:uncharacterized protein (TIGR02099 family)